jgi:hypothetical protein
VASFFVDVKGHTHKLEVYSLASSCGDVTGGVAFQFVDCRGEVFGCERECLASGPWVIALEELRSIVRRADEHREIAAIAAREVDRG